MSESKKEPKEQQKSLTGSMFAIIALIGLLIVFQFSLHNNTVGFVKGEKTTKVLGANDKTKVDEAKKTLQNSFEDKLENIQKQVTELDPQEVVVQSPQVKKILNDLKGLQDLPRDQAKQVCESLCRGI